MKNREELIKELKSKYSHNDRLIDLEGVADFIIADRKRIVEPLVNHLKIFDIKLGGQREQIPKPLYDRICERNGKDAIFVIDQTLKNAGVQDG
jgi:hypothetical protein